MSGLFQGSRDHGTLNIMKAETYDRLVVVLRALAGSNPVGRLPITLTCDCQNGSLIAKADYVKGTYRVSWRCSSKSCQERGGDGVPEFVIPVDS